MRDYEYLGVNEYAAMVTFSGEGGDLSIPLCLIEAIGHWGGGIVVHSVSGFQYGGISAELYPRLLTAWTDYLQGKLPKDEPRDA